MFPLSVIVMTRVPERDEPAAQRGNHADLESARRQGCKLKLRETWPAAS